MDTGLALNRPLPTRLAARGGSLPAFERASLAARSRCLGRLSPRTASAGSLPGRLAEEGRRAPLPLRAPRSSRRST